MLFPARGGYLVHAGLHYRNSTVVAAEMGRKIEALAAKKYLRAEQ